MNANAQIYPSLENSCWKNVEIAIFCLDFMYFGITKEISWYGNIFVKSGNITNGSSSKS